LKEKTDDEIDEETSGTPASSPQGKGRTEKTEGALVPPCQQEGRTERTKAAPTLPLQQFEQTEQIKDTPALSPLQEGRTEEHEDAPALRTEGEKTAQLKDCAIQLTRDDSLSEDQNEVPYLKDYTTISNIV